MPSTLATAAEHGFTEIHSNDKTPARRRPAVWSARGECDSVKGARSETNGQNRVQIVVFDLSGDLPRPLGSHYSEFHAQVFRDDAALSGLGNFCDQIPGALPRAIT